MSFRSVIEMYVFLIFLLFFVGTVHSIRCYQCISTNNTHPFQCNEFLSSDIDIEPESCDNVYEAQYCIKHIGRFEAAALDCYQCTSTDEWQCADSKLVKNYLQPSNCSHVYDARYCVKTIGRYGGGIGTKRFCSAAHLGNYCDYVKQMGDKLNYRTCIFTCNEDGCNSVSSLTATFSIWSLLIMILITHKLLFQR